MVVAAEGAAEGDVVTELVEIGEEVPAEPVEVVEPSVELEMVAMDAEEPDSEAN